MKKLNNKGFSLIELLIAFTAITILSFSIFRSIISIQRRQQINIAYNDYVVLQSSINSLIQKDFANEIIEAIEYSEKNTYRIKYVKKAEKTLSINTDKRTITYGTTIIKLPKTFIFPKDIEQKTETFSGTLEGMHDLLLMIRIPIDSNLLEQDLDIIYLYQYDSRVNPIRPNI